MESWCLSNHKLSWLFIIIMSINFMVQRLQGVCIEDERMALLEVKDSLQDSYTYDQYRQLYSSHKLLPTWVDDGECCEWERVKCDLTTGRVTHLSLSNMLLLPSYKYDRYYGYECLNNTTGWLLNISIFHQFEELRSLDLSYNRIVSTGSEMLSSLKKLELLDLSYNLLKHHDLFPSLSALTSLKSLDLGYNRICKEYYDISEFAALENLEVLDLTYGNYHGTFHMQGSQRDSVMKKLKVLNLGVNDFNESLISSLRFLPSLKSLDLNSNRISGSFPAEDLAYLTNLEKLDLSFNGLDTPSVQGCKSMLTLKRLESIALGNNIFNKSIISCLSFLPSLKILDLSSSYRLEGSFPIQELLSLRHDLEVLILRDNDFNGTLPMEALASLHNLEVLDLSHNNFVGSIPLTMQSQSSLRAILFAYNALNGSLPHDHGLCELKKLQELDISHNNFHGNLPKCFSQLSSLKVFDISSNQFTGKLPPSLIADLTSLEYIDFSRNQFEGSFSFSSFSNHTKLELANLQSDNDKFEVETEEPVGWIPMFQLKVLNLSTCNMNRRKGSVSPNFLLHQHELIMLDVSHNSLKGQFPSWLIENNTMLKFLNLKNNSIGGSFRMPFYKNAYLRHLDVSGNFLNCSIPKDIEKQLPNVVYLDLSRNSLDGVIPSSLGNLSELYFLDLSHNKLLAEVPTGLFSLESLRVLKLSNNRLSGRVLSGNLSLCNLDVLDLDSNCFTGKIDDETTNMSRVPFVERLDISNNFFTGKIPCWMGSLIGLTELVVRNNRFEGQFPCGTAIFSFLDISQNSFSGPIPSCLNWDSMLHLHLGSNKFTGLIPTFFRNLTMLLTLDIRNNGLSGSIPTFIGELSKLRILLLGKNNFSGSIPNQLCQLNKASLIDLSSNSLSGSIPSCLHNISGPRDLAFNETGVQSFLRWDTFNYWYKSVTYDRYLTDNIYDVTDNRDEAQFTTKSMSYLYKGKILDYIAGLDLSCNKLKGEIPPNLGMLTHILVLNISHNKLTGPIPVTFSNLAKIESLDLSSNYLIGHVPSELLKLNSLAIFNISYNNLSGRLPEMKAQFSTFNKDSYEGNPLLCGPPLEKKCKSASQVTGPLAEEDSDEKWYDMDMASFYGSCGSTWFVFVLGFGVALYINPYWRRRWQNFIEECIYTCHYFLYNSTRKLSVLLL